MEAAVADVTAMILVAALEATLEETAAARKEVLIEAEDAKEAAHPARTLIRTRKETHRAPQAVKVQALL